jgi:hypothetical protein
VPSSASSSSQDITKLITVADVKTGWFDAGVENGMNKLVPTLTLTLKNSSQQKVALVQLNAVIRRVGETEEWGAPTPARSVRMVWRLALHFAHRPEVEPQYTGIEPRNVMLKNSQFVDAHIQLFANAAVRAGPSSANTPSRVSSSRSSTLDRRLGPSMRPRSSFPT